MSDYVYDLAAIEAHKQRVVGQQTTIGGLSGQMSSAGAGGKEMYGILIGQIAHPILSHAAQGGADVITSLADLLEGMADGLQSTVQAYRDTESDHIDRTEQIVKHLDSIGDR